MSIHALSQLPSVTHSPIIISDFNAPSTSSLFTPAINRDSHVTILAQPQELDIVNMRRDEVRDAVIASVSTNHIHPLGRRSTEARYVKGYYDPSFISTDTNRHEFRHTVPASILSSERNMYDFPIVIDDDSPVNDDSTTNIDDMSYGVYTRMSGGAIAHNVDASANIANSRVFRLNDPMRYNLDNTSSYVHQLGPSPYPALTPTRLQAGMMTQPANMKSMYPELYPHVMREEVNGMVGTRVEDVASSSSLRSYGNIKAVPDGMVMESFGKSDETPKGNMTVAEQKIMTLKKHGKWPMKSAFRTKVRSSEDDLRDAMEAAETAASTKTMKVRPPSSVTKMLEENEKKTGKTSSTTPSRSTSVTSSKESMNVNTIRQLREGFTNPIEKEADYMYLEALKVRALAVCSYLKSNQLYSNWSSNWNLLESNLNRNGYLFERLDDTDADIAYVINKGSNVRFRIRDASRYVPLNIYQYVLYHEMAHMSTLDLQHTEKFQQLLSIISLAGFELGFIDMSRIGRDFYNTNGQPIMSRSSMKEEIITGAELLMEANPNSKEYYESIIEVVERA